MKASVYHGTSPQHPYVGNLFLTHAEKSTIETVCGYRVQVFLTKEDDGSLHFMVCPAVTTGPAPHQTPGVSINKIAERQFNDAEKQPDGHPWRISWTMPDRKIEPFGKTEAVMIDAGLGAKKIQGMVGDPEPLRDMGVRSDRAKKVVTAASKAPTIPQLRAAVETVNAALKADRNLAIVVDGRILRLTMSI